MAQRGDRHVVNRCVVSGVQYPRTRKHIRRAHMGCSMPAIETGRHFHNFLEWCLYAQWNAKRRRTSHIASTTDSLGSPVTVPLSLALLDGCFRTCVVMHRHTWHRPNHEVLLRHRGKRLPVYIYLLIPLGHRDCDHNHDDSSGAFQPSTSSRHERPAVRAASMSYPCRVTPCIQPLPFNIPQSRRGRRCNRQLLSSVFRF